MAQQDFRWREVEPLPDVNGDTRNLLATVDTLRVAWEEHLNQVSREEFEETRRRTLRRHAIETGIIEQLYDLTWGVTEALVAEGITREVAAREGISEDTLAIVNDQLDALELLVAAVRECRPLTASFLKELHAAITRSQPTYDARDQFGNLVRRSLPHGTWKEFPNDVTRADGSRLQYAPPEHVQSQIDRMLALYADSSNAHPVVRSAWLHHRFVLIHPFQDGNGRVARALTLMVLLQSRYAPLVVDRHQRGDYLDALDAANGGDLRPLVRLFARLELVALKAELSAPVSQASHAVGAAQVAHELVGRLRDRKKNENEQRAQATVALAEDMQQLVVQELRRLKSEFEPDFRSVDGSARITVSWAKPGDGKAQYWRGQIVYTARRVDFFADLSGGSWWTVMHVAALKQTLRFLVAIQKVGRGDPGVLAVTTFAEVVDRQSDRSPTEYRRAFEPTSRDSVTLVHTNSAGERRDEVVELIDRTLSTALKFFVDQLS